MSHKECGSRYPTFVQEIGNNLLQVFMGAENKGRAIENVV